MKLVHMKLLEHQTHLGHCQVNYSCRNDLGQRIFYCLQDNGDRHGGVRPMRCTRDFEPSHEVSFSKVLVLWDIPTGDNSTEKKVKEWILKRSHLSMVTHA